MLLLIVVLWMLTPIPALLSACVYAWLTSRSDRGRRLAAKPALVGALVMALLLISVLTGHVTTEMSLNMGGGTNYMLDRQGPKTVSMGWAVLNFLVPAFTGYLAGRLAWPRLPVVAILAWLFGFGCLTVALLAFVDNW